jgi:hypothetical protein
VSIVEKTLSLRTRELRKAPVSVLLSNMIRRFSGSTFITGSTFNPSHAVETERQRDRETERQRDRDRETERKETVTPLFLFTVCPPPHPPPPPPHITPYYAIMI